MDRLCGGSGIGGTKRRSVVALLVLAITPAAMMTATSAHAATQTWDPLLTTTGSDGVGNWDTTTADWASGGADGVYINDGTTTPTFGAGGTVGNITLNAANLNANGINFNLGYTINTTGTDTLTLSSANVTVAAGITAVINAPLAGTHGLALTGNGTLTLGTASTALSGDVSIGAGSTLKVTGLNTNGSFASSTLAWASLGYASNTESVGPFSVFGPTNAGTGNITVANGGTLSFGTASNNVINFGMKTVFIAGTGTGAGAITNPNQAGNGRQFTAFNFLTLTADATISGSRMDIGRDGDPANVIPDKLDLAGHTLTINMNGSAQPMFGIQAGGNAKGNNVGTVVTSGQIDVLKGSLDLELNANLSNDGTSKITFEDTGAFGNTGANIEFFKTDGTSCTRPMVFKGHNIIGPGAANAGAALASNLTITGPIGFESDVSGNPGNATANCTLTLAGNIVENGTASISLLGSSTTVLTGTNTWTGGTNFGFSGTLTLGSAGAFPAGTPISFGNASGLGGTFDLGGFNATVSAITAVANGDLTSTIGNSSTTTPSTLTYAGNIVSPGTFAGIIKDSVATNINVAGTATARTGTQTMAVAITSGQLTLTGANTYSGGTSVTGGVLVVGSSGALGTGPLAVHGGLVQVASGLGTLLLPGLTLDSSGAIDLANNRFVVEATVSKASALSNIQSHAHTALTSSTIAVNYGIAVIDNDNGAGGTRFSTFGGQSVDANSILIGPELLGDANADGKVDANDLNTVLSHFGALTFAWTSGNFDGASTIDLTDLANVLNNFGDINGNPSVAPVSAPAPEPASLAMLGLGVVALGMRRRMA